MRIAVVNLLMRTAKSERPIPQLDRTIPKENLVADSPMVVALGDELARMGHDVDIFVGSIFKVIGDRGGGKTASLVSTQEKLKSLFPPTYYPFAPSVGHRLDKGGYDVVMTTDLIQPCTLMSMNARSSKRGVFVWEELASHPRFPVSWYSKALYAALRARKFRGIRRAMPRSESAREFLLSQGVPPALVSQIIPNAVDCNTFSPLQGEDFFDRAGLQGPPRPRTLMVARVDRTKGIETFLKAVRIAKDRGHKGGFVLKATGKSTSGVEAAAKAAGVERQVSIIGGYLPRKDLANLMASCDLCAAPSTGDLLFFVPLEAMASGLPVITTTQTHHARTFADGKAGAVIDANDPESLARTIIEISEDRDRLRRMSAAARDTAVNEFSMESVARRLVEEFQRD